MVDEAEEEDDDDDAGDVKSMGDFKDASPPTAAPAPAYVASIFKPAVLSLFISNGFRCVCVVTASPSGVVTVINAGSIAKSIIRILFTCTDSESSWTVCDAADTSLTKSLL